MAFWIVWRLFHYAQIPIVPVQWIFALISLYGMLSILLQRFRPWKYHDFYYGQPCIFSYWQSISFSFLRHLSIFYSQSGHNANPNALKSFFTYTLLITLLLCQLQGSLLLCISLLPLSLTTETTIWNSLLKNTRHSCCSRPLNTEQQSHFDF